MRHLARPAIALLAVALALGPLTAQAGGHYGGGYRGGYGHGGGGWGPGLLLGGIGLGLIVGSRLASDPYYAPAPYYGAAYYGGGYYPGYVVAEPPPVVYVPAPPTRYVQVQPQAPVAPAAAAAPDPIIYPHGGQSAAQTEADRQDCNRWATTQRNAMADASVFQRATFACLEGRGYTVR